MKSSDPAALSRAGRFVAAPLLWLAAACGQAAPNAPGADPDPWADAPTVRQLLHMDAAAALANRRALLAPSLESGASGVSPPSPPGMSPADRVQVAAIYGVGAGLRAEVLINDALRIYRSGRKQAEGRQAAVDGYDLVAITGACVSLRKGDQPLVACLESRPSSAME